MQNASRDRVDGDAEALACQALATRTRQLGATHVETAQATALLGTIRATAGDTRGDEATPLVALSRVRAGRQLRRALAKWKAASWNDDASRICIYGSSSGGQVAELVAMRPREPRDTHPAAGGAGARRDGSRTWRWDTNGSRSADCRLIAPGRL